MVVRYLNSFRPLITRWPELTDILSIKSSSKTASEVSPLIPRNTRMPCTRHLTLTFTNTTDTTANTSPSSSPGEHTGQLGPLERKFYIWYPLSSPLAREA